MTDQRSNAERARRRDTERSILWPLVYGPLLFILALHVGVRIPWFFGIGTGGSSGTQQSSR